eukprot:7613547-Karenia_brevis.AAC.1
MDLHQASRPNRSAAARRQQQQRSDARSYAKLYKYAQTFNHRGAQLPTQFQQALGPASLPTDSVAH